MRFSREQRIRKLYVFRSLAAHQAIANAPDSGGHGWLWPGGIAVQVGHGGVCGRPGAAPPGGADRLLDTARAALVLWTTNFSLDSAGLSGPCFLWSPDGDRPGAGMTPQLPGAAELGDDAAALAGDIGATFDHVAVAGRRIRDMLPLWRDTLGGRFVVGADNPEIGWGGGRVALWGGWWAGGLGRRGGGAFL